MPDTISENREVSKRLTPKQLVEYKRELRNSKLQEFSSVKYNFQQSMIFVFSWLRIELPYLQFVRNSLSESVRKLRRLESSSTRSSRERGKELHGCTSYETPGSTPDRYDEDALYNAY